MRLSHPSSLGRKMQDWIFFLLLLGILLLSGWLAARHDIVFDWSSGKRNSLHEASRQILTQLEGPLVMTSFAPDNRVLRERIDRLLQRYRRERPDIEIRYLDPDLNPETSRRTGITLAGELVLEYAGKRETLQELSEPRITQAIRRLMLDEPVWVVALEGHGERRVDGQANHDLGQFAGRLREEGFAVRGIDLATHPALPENTRVLVLTNPEIALFPGELDLLLGYLDQGGNLLWLLDPGEWNGLDAIASRLSIERLPGVVVDANASELNIDDPSVALVPRYPDHPVTRTLESLTLFPESAALHSGAAAGWTAAPILQTLDRSWNETGPLRGKLSRDDELGEVAGPLLIGVALTRELEDGGEQRVVIVGDGDFLSNAYLDNSGNLDLGLRLMRWLGGVDRLLDIPTELAPDREFALGPKEQMWFGATVLVAAPLLFLLSGAVIWWRRRRG